ncbi:MAG: sugar phosphate isomerase/epimerase [Armatimonadota bacterium]|nr:sugar phosphate isomerase/epimerase [Armatimonadota bacterium]
MFINQTFGIHSYCFRNFSNEEFARAALELGVDNVSISNVHGRFQEPDGFDDVIAIYRNAGLPISNIGVVQLTGDEQADRNPFEFARRAGTKILAVNFKPDTFDKASKLAQELAEEYDVRCGIHNHGGYHWLGNSEILEHIFKNSGPRLGLFLDTAWALAARQNPVEMARKFGDRLYGIHLKDFVFDRSGKPEDVIVGTGGLDLPAFVRTVAEAGFDGSCTLEYEAEADNPLPALKQCAEAIRGIAL